MSPSGSTEIKYKKKIALMAQQIQKYVKQWNLWLLEIIQIIEQ